MDKKLPVPSKEDRRLFQGLLPFCICNFQCLVLELLPDQEAGQAREVSPQAGLGEASQHHEIFRNNEKKQFNNMTIKLTNFEDSKINVKENVLHVTGNFC